jgi:hypothetical protein
LAFATAVSAGCSFRTNAFSDCCRTPWNCLQVLRHPTYQRHSPFFDAAKLPDPGIPRRAIVNVEEARCFCLGLAARDGFVDLTHEQTPLRTDTQLKGSQ